VKDMYVTVCPVFVGSRQFPLHQLTLTEPTSTERVVVVVTSLHQNDASTSTPPAGGKETRAQAQRATAANGVASR